MRCEWSLARDTNSLGGEAGAEDRLVELHCTDDKDDQLLQPDNSSTYHKKFSKSDSDFS